MSSTPAPIRRRRPTGAMGARVVILALLALGAPDRATAQPVVSGLEALLAAELDRFPARTGLYVHHLESGARVAIRGDDAFNSQSVIKLMILVRAFQLADEGTLDLSRRVEIGREHLRHGAGILQYQDPGSTPTLRDLLMHMVTTSDNIATDIMLEQVGGTGELNRWIAASGYTQTWKVNQGWEYRRKLLALLDPRFAGATAEETTALQYALAGSPLLDHYADLFTGDRADWPGIVQDPEARRLYAERRDVLMVDDEDYWLGHMTPRETGLLLEGIERCTVASREACDTIRLFLRQQQAGARRLRQFLGVPIGHKTGDSAVISNDVGIIYARSGPIVVAFFVNGIEGPLAEAETRMGRIAQLIVGFFDGAPDGE